MNFYWRRVESQEKLQRRGNSVHNITLVGFRGQKFGDLAIFTSQSKVEVGLPSRTAAVLPWCLAQTSPFRVQQYK